MTAQVLLLDFGSVISKSLFETLEDIEATFGLEPGTLDWSGPLAGRDDALWQSMQRDEISERDYWYRRAAELSEQVGETLTIKDIIRRSRGQDVNSVIRPEVVAVVQTAKAAGRTTAIFTNEMQLFYGADVIEQLDLLNHMDHLFDATTTKILKPDPRAYEMVCAGLGLPPGQIVFVDDQTRNIAGAKAVGMLAVKFDINTPRACFNQALTLLGIPTLDESVA